MCGERAGFHTVDWLRLQSRASSFCFSFFFSPFSGGILMFSDDCQEELSTEVVPPLVLVHVTALQCLLWRSVFCVCQGAIGRHKRWEWTRWLPVQSPRRFPWAGPFPPEELLCDVWPGLYWLLSVQCSSLGKCFHNLLLKVEMFTPTKNMGFKHQASYCRHTKPITALLPPQTFSLCEFVCWQTNGQISMHNLPDMGPIS